MRIRLDLPFPMTTNHYWKRTRTGMRISDEGKAFSEEVFWRVREQLVWHRMIEDKLRINVDLYPRTTAAAIWITTPANHSTTLCSGLKCIGMTSRSDRASTPGTTRSRRRTVLSYWRGSEHERICNDGWWVGVTAY